MKIIRINSSSEQDLAFQDSKLSLAMNKKVKYHIFFYNYKGKQRRKKSRYTSSNHSSSKKKEIERKNEINKYKADFTSFTKNQ